MLPITAIVPAAWVGGLAGTTAHYRHLLDNMCYYGYFETKDDLVRKPLYCFCDNFKFPLEFHINGNVNNCSL